MAGATVLLETKTWDSSKDALPDAGRALLDELALPWRGMQFVRSGRWRRALVGATPAPLSTVVASLIGLLDIAPQIGSRGERRPRGLENMPPALAPDARMVWQGRSGRPFLVSSGPQMPALEALCRRSHSVFGLGAAVFCFTLYPVAEFFVAL